MNADRSILLNPRLSTFIGGPNYFSASKAGDLSRIVGYGLITGSQYPLPTEVTL
jgi:hypothetical protein